MSVLGEPLVPMRLEGIELVRGPLPVYLHAKSIHSDEEGMEVAALLAESSAVLLEGHGATTTGSSLEDAVMTMLQLEEQARMNWHALCAAGPGHRRIADALIAEISERPPLRELAHFRDVFVQRGKPRLGYVVAYDHFSALVSGA